MNTYADKTQENKNQSVSKIVPKQTDSEFTFQFEDNSPEAISQRKFQEMADNSPQAKLIAQMQSMIDNSSRMLRQRQQIKRMFGRAVQRQETLREEEPQMKAEATPVQRKSPEEEELLQGKFEPVQRQSDLEEEEPLQGKFEPIQKQELEQDELQSKEAPIQEKDNKTGLPDNLKSGIENLSGHSMDDVKVRYNSDKPAQLNAHAYTQDTDIHVGSGQEKHLLHEAWQVVQQKQGRVQPTIQLRGKENWVPPVPVPSDHTGRVGTVQRVNEPAEPSSPEAKQIINILNQCTIDGALPDNLANPPANSIDFLKTQLPSVPVARIRQALINHPIATEAWESMFLDQTMYSPPQVDHYCTPLGGATIGGHREKWTVLGYLGSGTEANVLRGWGVGAAAAIKIFKGNTAAMEQAFSAEVDAHQKLQALERQGIQIPNLVRMLDYNNLLRTIVMDLVPGKALDPDGSEERAVLEKRDQALEQTRTALAKQGYRLADVQPRNTMYDPETDTIKFVDITLERIDA